jgi:hypothetical protein
MVTVDLPRDVYVVGIAGPPGGNDCDVVEAIRPPSRLPDADLYFQEPLRSSQPMIKPNEPGRATLWFAGGSFALSP